MSELGTMIAAVDVAVVDVDLLWRVEHMNLLRSVVAREFTAPAEALEALTPGHGSVLVLGPSAQESHISLVAEARKEHPEMRVVVVAKTRDPAFAGHAEAIGVDCVIPAEVSNEVYTNTVLGLVPAWSDEIGVGRPTGRPAKRKAKRVTASGVAASPAVPEPAAPEQSAGPSWAVPADDALPDAAEAPATPAAEAPSGEALENEEVAPPGRVTQARTPRTGGVPKRFVVLTSAKGGEGTSTVALNLACSFAAVPNVRVAIIDGEPYFGDIAMDIGAAPEASPMIVELPIVDEIVDQLVAEPLDGGPIVVRYPLATGALAEKGPDVLRELVALADERADVVVADVPFDLLLESGLASEASIVALVTTRRTASVKNTVLGARRLGLSGNVGVVVNETDRRQRVASVDALARTIGIPLLGHLPFSGPLHRAASKPRPVEIAEPHSHYAHSMISLRRAIASHFRAYT